MLRNNPKFIFIKWFHDQSQSTINDWKSYYGNDPALVEYPSNLDICHHIENKKYAFEHIKAELIVRGWLE